jgi:hypothetical protein
VLRWIENFFLLYLVGRLSLSPPAGTERTPVSKYAVIAAVERKPWRSLGHITREMKLSKPIFRGILHKITCLWTTAHGYHICFQTIAYYRCSFSTWLRQQRDADELCLRTFLWTDLTCFRVEVCCPSTAVTCDSGIALLPLADNVADIVVGSHLPHDRLTPQRCRNFVDTLLPGFLQDKHPYPWEKCGFSTKRAGTLHKDVRQRLNVTSPGRWIGILWPITWRPLSPNLSRILSVVSNEQQ